MTTKKQLEAENERLKVLLKQLEAKNKVLEVLLPVNRNRVNLKGADLEEVNLEGADLKGARYDSETIFPEDFDYKNSGAIGPEANLEGAWLKGVNLRGARLEGASLEGAKPYVSR